MRNYTVIITTDDEVGLFNSLDENPQVIDYEIIDIIGEEDEQID